MAGGRMGGAAEGDPTLRGRRRTVSANIAPFGGCFRTPVLEKGPNWWSMELNYDF